MIPLCQEINHYNFTIDIVPTCGQNRSSLHGIALSIYKKFHERQQLQFSASFPLGGTINTNKVPVAYLTQCICKNVDRMLARRPLDTAITSCSS
jgi:hypothetical protein